jgi:hypothetical protein
MSEQWTFRPGKDPNEQLLELERTFGIQNLKDVSIELIGASYYLQIVTGEKKFRALLTEV